MHVYIAYCCYSYLFLSFLGTLWTGIESRSVGGIRECHQNQKRKEGAARTTKLKLVHLLFLQNIFKNSLDTVLEAESLRSDGPITSPCG